MDFAKLRSLGKPAAPRAVGGHTRVTGIVKVNADHYKPANVQVRTEVSARIFTAEFDSEELSALRRDPHVESVALNEALPLQKLP